MASTLIVLLMALNAAAQWQCGGTTYVPGSVNFTTECMQTAQNCISQFATNTSQEYCQDVAGNLYMQQEPYDGNNNDYTSAFQDILDFCLLDG